MASLKPTHHNCIKRSRKSKLTKKAQTISIVGNTFISFILAYLCMDSCLVVSELFILIFICIKMEQNSDSQQNVKLLLKNNSG